MFESLVLKWVGRWVYQIKKDVNDFRSMAWTDTTDAHVGINHDVLIKKLSAMGVRALVRGIAAFLLDCEHRVKLPTLC